MDKGTDARAILTGKHLPLKKGYIGVVNRSQKDIDSRKKMSEALKDEMDFFKSHPSYKDLTSKLGIGYLQKYLNQELKTHILKTLPPLRREFQTELESLNEQLDTIEAPSENINPNMILSEINDQFRRNYESSVGGKGGKIDITKLSIGAKINSIMNTNYADDINQMTYNEETLRQEIANAIHNYYGIHLGTETPDAAFKAVVEHQIELFRKPSLSCVEWVSTELRNIIYDCVGKINRFSNIK